MSLSVDAIFKKQSFHKKQEDRGKSVALNLLVFESYFTLELISIKCFS